MTKIHATSRINRMTPWALLWSAMMVAALGCAGFNDNSSPAVWPARTDGGPCAIGQCDAGSQQAASAAVHRRCQPAGSEPVPAARSRASRRRFRSISQGNRARAERLEQQSDGGPATTAVSHAGIGCSAEAGACQAPPRQRIATRLHTQPPTMAPWAHQQHHDVKFACGYQGNRHR